MKTYRGAMWGSRATVSRVVHVSTTRQTKTLLFLGGSLRPRSWMFRTQRARRCLLRGRLFFCELSCRYSSMEADNKHGWSRPPRTLRYQGCPHSQLCTLPDRPQTSPRYALDSRPTALEDHIPERVISLLILAVLRSSYMLPLWGRRCDARFVASGGRQLYRTKQTTDHPDSTTKAAVSSFPGVIQYHLEINNEEG